LSPPLPLSITPTKPANPGSSGKMVVKMEREMERYLASKTWPDF